jgi:uncharacterized protein
METSKYFPDEIFLSPTAGTIRLTEIISEIKKYIREEPESFYRLVIGSDSHARKDHGNETLDFVTAIVIHRKGRGGRYFWHKIPQNKTYSLREKIYAETLISLDLAQLMVPRLKKVLNGENYVLEIHIDVGEHGPTREMIKEVVGMVSGNGYTVKTKPESFGAYVIADKYT